MPARRRGGVVKEVSLSLSLSLSISGKRGSIHHHLLEVIFETATVPELRRKLLYTTPSGWWWWCIESVFRLSLIRTSASAARALAPQTTSNIIYAVRKSGQARRVMCIIFQKFRSFLTACCKENMLLLPLAARKPKLASPYRLTALTAESCWQTKTKYPLV